MLRHKSELFFVFLLIKFQMTQSVGVFEPFIGWPLFQIARLPMGNHPFLYITGQKKQKTNQKSKQTNQKRSDKTYLNLSQVIPYRIQSKSTYGKGNGRYFCIHKKSKAFCCSIYHFLHIEVIKSSN